VKFDHIAGFKVLAYFRLFTVYRHVAFFNGRLNLRAGKRFISLCQKNIQPQARLFRAYGE